MKIKQYILDPTKFIYTKRFLNFLYWFIHNEIGIPLLVITLIIIAILYMPFSLVWGYLYSYYKLSNGL